LLLPPAATKAKSNEVITVSIFLIGIFFPRSG